MNQIEITYRNSDNEVVPAPVPTFRPTKRKPAPGPDDFVELNTRLRRRLYERGQKSAQRKARARHVKTDIDRQNTASDLANLFNIIDRRVPSRNGFQRYRAQRLITDKIYQIVTADRDRYDAEITARQADRTLAPPRPVITHAEVEQRLRGIAKTGTIYLPKSER